jgi:hypothetical protein
MTSVSVPKNSYMLWLKENRNNIKQMYFSNYIPKINTDGKKENLQCVLTKKAGEIWSSLDSDTKEVYNIKLKKLIHGDGVTETTYSVDDYPSPPFNWTGPFQMKYLSKNAKGVDGKALSFIRFDEAVQEARKIDTCGGITKTSHGYSLRVGSNLLSTFDGDPTGLASWKKTKELPPPYEVNHNVKTKRKAIPKAVKNSVWNKYIETDDLKKLIGKCFVGCGCEITIANFETGHVIAYSKGGSDKVDNLRPICSTCNKSMGTMNLLEFKETYGLGNGLDSKPDEVLTEEQLECEIEQLNSVIKIATDENDTLVEKNVKENLKLEKCNLEKININDTISNYKSKIQTKKCDINEQIDILKLQIDDLQTSLKEDISLINKYIKENTIKLKENNKQYIEYKDTIDSIKEKIDLNINSIEYLNTDKHKYESLLEDINMQKKVEHNSMIKKIEQEVKEELQKDQLRKQIKERLLQEQLTKQGNLINLIN